MIHYRRVHEGALEVSDYEIVPVADPAPLHAMLSGALGVIAEIRKVRTLLMRRNVRLHLDRVEGLGSFGEIEAVVAADEPPEIYRVEVDDILAALEVMPADLISESYFELMSAPGDTGLSDGHAVALERGLPSPGAERADLSLDKERC